MKHHETPDIGDWFKDQEGNSIFEVVASDESDDYVEIQHFAGEIEEFDIETWYQLDLKRIPPPDDWSGPFELSKEDTEYFDDIIQVEDWTNPLVEIEPEEIF